MKDKWANPEWSGAQWNIGNLPKTEKHRANLSKALTGKSKSDQHKENLRQGKLANGTGRVRIPGLIKINAANYTYNGWQIKKCYPGKWEATMNDIKYIDKTLTLLVNKWLLKNE